MKVKKPSKEQLENPYNIQYTIHKMQQNHKHM